MSTSTRRDLVIVASAVSAGVHAALAPAHFDESVAEGTGFVVATVMLVLVIVALAFRPGSRAVSIGSSLVFGALLVSYAFAATTGIQMLHPEPEAVDGLALDTKVVELFGLALVVDLIPRRAVARVPLPAIALTVMIAVFSALLALALSGGHHHA